MYMSEGKNLVKISVVKPADSDDVDEPEEERLSFHSLVPGQQRVLDAPIASHGPDTR